MIFIKKGEANIRTAQKLINGQWVECEFIKLRRNDVFRLLDDGVLYVDANGNSDYVVLKDPYENDDGIWQVDVEIYKERSTNSTWAEYMQGLMQQPNIHQPFYLKRKLRNDI